MAREGQEEAPKSRFKVLIHHRTDKLFFNAGNWTALGVATSYQDIAAAISDVKNYGLHDVEIYYSCGHPAYDFKIPLMGNEHL